MRLLLYAIPLVIMLYAFIDCVQTPRVDARNLPKWLWLVLVVIVPLVGAVCWLLLGRPRSGELVGVGGRSRRQAAPDDDPTFLRQLDDQEWQRRMQERREQPGEPGTGSG